MNFNGQMMSHEYYYHLRITLSETIFIIIYQVAMRDGRPKIQNDRRFVTFKIIKNINLIAY